MATSTEQKTDQVLQFEKLNSTVDSTFWQQFGRKKIDEFKLSEDPIEIFGTFTGGIFHSNVVLPPKLFFDRNAFDVKTPQIPQFHFQIRGQLINTNTIESFRDLDKKQLLHNQSMQIVNDITSGKFLTDPSLLYRFFMISFADLKRHKYIYWLCFPAIVPKTFKIIQNSITKLTNYSKYKSAKQQQLIVKNFYKFCGDNPLSQSLLFIIDHNLSFHTLSSTHDKKDILMFGYIDNGNLPSAPSWFLRNILLAIAVSFEALNTTINILCVRNLVNNLQDSIILNVTLTNSDKSALLKPENIRCTGWERNSNKLLPKKIDLSAYLDPVVLSSESVYLNLKLMRWRRVPNIDLDLIKNQKCLLCGSGTLGTYMSRVLLAWGCSNITFIDNGAVSHSNPVRQCLYKYTDHNQAKSHTSAASIKEIFPRADAKGYQVSIPMMGHYVDSKQMESVKADFVLLEKLIREHDIIFLLTDSRESRWLPTLLSKVHNKIVINIALGFDSFVIMRHSHNNDGLACYFCSDVVAPNDSISDRSLDEQCTVTRPGLAPVAVGLGCELLISYLQKECSSKLCNDEIPHQIRGFLYDFKQIAIKETAGYDHCVACSQVIVDEYKMNGWDFILRAINEPEYVETVCGLKKIKEEINCNLDDIDMDWISEEDEEEKDRDDEYRCIILLGAPASGKATQAPRLVNKFEIPYVEFRDIVDENAIHEKVEQCVTGNKYKNGFILDGYPRTVKDAQFLNEKLKENSKKVTHLIHLRNVSNTALKKRILGRLIHRASGRSYHSVFNPPQIAGKDDLTGDELIKRSDDNEKEFERKLKQFNKDTIPVIEYYANSDNKQCVYQIDADCKPHQLSHKIDKCFD